MDTSKARFKLIIGLGNPDKKYENTYHSVGHLFIDYLTKSSQLKAKSFKSDVYMNESGKFVAKELKRAGVKPKELLIVHDDSDLILGAYKIQFGRGAAGHHGVENIQATLKTKDFWRLRIGVRPPPLTSEKREVRRLKAEKFVLKKITAADRKIIEETLQKATLIIS